MEAEKSLTWVCDQLKASNWSAENRKKVNDLACENIRFSSLFAAGDVSRNVPSGEERGETDVFAGYKWLQKVVGLVIRRQ